MNALWHLYPGDTVAVLAANVAVQITAVTSLALLAARRFTKDHPAARHALLLSALICVLLSPVLTYLAHRVDVAVFRIPVASEAPYASADAGGRKPSATRHASDALTPRPLLSATTFEATALPNSEQPKQAVVPNADSERPVSRSLGDRLRAAGGAIVGIWLAGAFWLLVRLLYGCWGLYRLRRGTRLVELSEILRLDERFWRRIGVSRLPPIGISSRIAGPVTAGVLRPTVILPEHLVPTLEAEQLRDVLVHECAHVVRRDHLVSLLQRAVQILFWPHPLVNWVNRELARAREEVCDNYVLGEGDDVRYARTLLEVSASLPASGTFPVAVGLLPPRWNLEERIAAFLDANRKPITHLNRWKAAAIAAGLLLVAAATAGTGLGASEDARKQRTQPTRPNTETAASAEPATAKTVDVHGRVVDPDGKPFQGAKLYVLYPRTNESTEQAVSDADGRFRLVVSRTDLKKARNAKPGAGVRLICTASGYGLSVQDVDARDPARPLTVRLARLHGAAKVAPAVEAQTETVVGKRPRGNCSISGKVVSASTGKPVDHATMYLFYLATHGAIFINVASDGTFLFKDIPTGPFSLCSTKTAGYQDASYDPEGKSGRFPQFSLEDGEHKSGIVLKLRRAHRISGRILDENGKLPKNIGSLSVLAWIEKDDGNGYQSEQARVNRADGSYLIDGLDDKPVYVMAINWRAAKEGNAYPPIYYPGTFFRSDAKPITFEEKRDIDDIDITLQKEGGLILQGTVTDETGKPVPEAFVVVHRRDMHFDFVTAYTDEQGRYRIQGLGDGEFLVHVDAVHRGFVRTRTPIDLERANNRTQQDFTLRRGATISGKFVDEEGNDWHIGQSYGSAYVIKHQQGPASSFSLTGFWNKYRPKDVASGHGGSFATGSGDYCIGQMLFPTKGTFVIQGLRPGHATIVFYPKKEGQKVAKILYDGRNIKESGIVTKPGQEIKDVRIVIGAQ